MKLTSRRCFHPDRLFPVLLSLALALSFGACSGKSSSDASQGVGKRAILLSAPAPIVKVAADDMSPGLSFLSWDTEGGEKAATNLLRAGNAVRVQYLAVVQSRKAVPAARLARDAWQDAKVVDRRHGSDSNIVFRTLEAGPARLEWRIETTNELDRVVTERESKIPARTDRFAQPHGLRPRRRPDRPRHAPPHLPLRPQGHLDDRPPRRMARRRDLPPPRGHQRSRLGPDAPRGGERASGRRPPRRLARRARPST